MLNYKIKKKGDVYYLMRRDWFVSRHIETPEWFPQWIERHSLKIFKLWEWYCENEVKTLGEAKIWLGIKLFKQRNNLRMRGLRRKKKNK